MNAGDFYSKIYGECKYTSMFRFAGPWRTFKQSKEEFWTQKVSTKKSC